ncbi:MAG: hypothetical protein Ct9H300mP13_5510 [Gammaproteobacteria bacterium]|nr:MAG: hypothetical protein Ct9H300mP13_5510 [Gammaproteobacteria bacterium]
MKRIEFWRRGRGGERFFAPFKLIQKSFDGSYSLIFVAVAGGLRLFDGCFLCVSSTGKGGPILIAFGDC